MLSKFAQTVTEDATTYHGFDIVPTPTAGPNGIAWEFTAQAALAMQLVDRLYGQETFDAQVADALAELHKAQTTDPLGDGEGLVAATIQSGDTLPPGEQCLSTPFQCIPERTGLAATSFAILAESDVNPLASAQPPSSTSPPAISGSAAQGQTLSESHGSWTGSPTSYGYRWENCDAPGGSCSTIPGATGQTYLLAAADVGHTIRVQEWATNIGGTGGPAVSAPTPVVQAPGEATCKATVGRARVRGTAASVPLRSLGASGASCTITLTMIFTRMQRGGKLAALRVARHRVKTTRHTIVVGRNTVTLGVGQSKTVQVKLNAVGKHLLASHHKLSVKLKATRIANSGTIVVSTQRLTFKAP